MARRAVCHPWKIEHVRNCLEIMIPISSFYAKDAHTHTNGILSSFILIGYASAAATSEERVLGYILVLQN